MQRRTDYPEGSVTQLCVQPHAPLLGACDELIGIHPRGLEVDNRYVAHLEWPPSCHLHRETPNAPQQDP